MSSLRVLASKKVWWIALALLLIGAGILRLAGYNFSLPYIDHGDEVDFYWTGQEWRGLFDFHNYLRGYPPLYIWINIGVQIVGGVFGVHGLPATIQVLRLLSLLFSLVTLLMIVITARLSAGWLAGIIAGLGWAVAPLVLENATYATPDPLVYLTVSMAVCFAVIALIDEKRSHWCVWSVLAGCLAILTKYYVLTAVLPGMVTTLIIFRRDRRLGWHYFGLQALLLAITAAISIPGIAVLGNEGARARSSGLANILNPSRVLNNIYQAFQPLNALFFLITAGLGTVVYWIARREQRVRADVVLLCLLILISIPWLAATFSVVSPVNRMKDVLPSTTAACVLLGIAAAQVVRLLPRLFRAVVVIVPLALVLVPQFNADAALMQDRVRPDTRVVLRQWADVNLTPGTVLVGAENQNTFNPYWGGLQGQHWFDWILTRDFTSKSAQDWRVGSGVSYVVYSEDQWKSMQATSAGQSYLAQMLFLRSIILPNDRGPQMVVYRLWGIQHPTDVKFGDSIDLLGYDLDSDTVTTGGHVTFTFYWRAETTPADNYSLFIHLNPQGQNTLIAQADGAPARDERPTLSWTEPDETLISQPFVLNIPADAPPGSDDLQIGLYNYQTGARLPITAAAATPDDTYLLTNITIR